MAWPLPSTSAVPSASAVAALSLSLSLSLSPAALLRGRGEAGEGELSPHSALSLSPSPSLPSLCAASLSPSASPVPTAAASAGISAALRSVQEDLSEKMSLSDRHTDAAQSQPGEPGEAAVPAVKAETPAPAAPAAGGFLNHPLQTLLTAAVPSPSNASVLEQAKAALSASLPASAAALSPSERRSSSGSPLRVITPSSAPSAAAEAATPAKPRRRHSLTSSFLASSPSASPQPSSATSPFMSIASPLTPVTATTASTSSVGSAQQASGGSSSSMPLSPLSPPYTPSYAASTRPQSSDHLLLQPLSVSGLQQHMEGGLQQLQHDLSSLHALMVHTPPSPTVGGRPSALSSKWQHVAVPLAPRPLRLLSNLCRDLLALRSAALLHCAQLTRTVRASSAGLPSLFDSELSAVHRYALSARYYGSAELKAVHDVLVSVLGHAYSRATSNVLPMRTTRDEGAGGSAQAGSVGLCVNGCGCEARVSVLLPCLHVSCWDCLGRRMRDSAGSCKECGPSSPHTAYAVSVDRPFVLDENEALLLAAQYLLSSYALPASSPVLSPLMYPQPSPSLSAASTGAGGGPASSTSPSSRKRKLSAALPSSPTPPTPPAASSAFTRRPSHPRSAVSAFTSPNPAPLTLSPAAYASPMTAAFVSSGPWSPIPVGAATAGAAVGSGPGVPAFSLSAIGGSGGHGALSTHHAHALHHPPLHPSPPPYLQHGHPVITITGPRPHPSQSPPPSYPFRPDPHAHSQAHQHQHQHQHQQQQQQQQQQQHAAAAAAYSSMAYHGHPMHHHAAASSYHGAAAVHPGSTPLGERRTPGCVSRRLDGCVRQCVQQPPQARQDRAQRGQGEWEGEEGREEGEGRVRVLVVVARS